jgi:hypothetical protein
VRSKTTSALIGIGALTVGLFGVVPAGLAEPFRATSAATYNLSAPPVSSFQWFPAFPRVGERFSLVSTSTDLVSPISTYAWDVADDGPFGAFQAGGPAATATFSTPANHVVRLRVTSADHLSAIASETIRMGSPPPGVLQPFPTVRISGRLVRSGIRLSVVRVRAPAHARIMVTCRGRGCPTRSQARTAAARPTSFRKFERFLPARVSLVIRVSKGASIGAYTLFAVRRGKLPVRRDSCLAPTGTKPIACPSA